MDWREKYSLPDNISLSKITVDLSGMMSFRRRGLEFIQLTIQVGVCVAVAADRRRLGEAPCDGIRVEVRNRGSHAVLEQSSSFVVGISDPFSQIVVVRHNLCRQN